MMLNRMKWFAMLAIPLLSLALLAGRSEVAFGQKPTRPSDKIQTAKAKVAASAKIRTASAKVAAPAKNRNAKRYVPSTAGIRDAERNVFVPANYALQVQFDRRLPEPEATLHRQVMGLLNEARIGVPFDRMDYFRSVLSPDSAKMIGGWHGMIDSIHQIENGIVVDLLVTAIQSGMADTTTLIERYSIINGKVRYIGSHVPENIVRFSVSF